MTLDLTKILYCLYNPKSPDSVATAWVIRHVCQRDAISLELAANEPDAAAPPDFFDRHVVVAAIRWPLNVINLLARHSTTTVLFPTLNGFESYDTLKTVPPYRTWTKDGYAITEIAPSDPQHVGRGYVCREVGISPQVAAWRFFRPATPVPSFLTGPATAQASTDPDGAFAAYDDRLYREGLNVLNNAFPLGHGTGSDGVALQSASHEQYGTTIEEVADKMRGGGILKE